jgi:hypothetical protein
MCRITFLFFLFRLFIAPFSTAAQTFTEILGRPTNQSVTISALFSQVAQVHFEYGTSPGDYSQSTPMVTSEMGKPVVMDFQPLLPNTRYYYRTFYQSPGSSNIHKGNEHTFHTQRPPGSTFRFDLEADEHLHDKKGVSNMYKVTLQNQSKDSADFMLSLGDIFGDDHTPEETTSADMDALHKDYLQYLGAVCHSIPFFICLGNHEGESGYYLNQTPPENIAVYGTQWRKFYYPNPYPNDFYSGNMTEEPYGVGKPENYFSWTWGDALFVVLDVYRDCAVNEKPQKWDWTLGETQYNWLKQTLENSHSAHKFVFAHHTRGQGRGGVATATGFEWGGYDGGNWKFDTYRPGWAMPIHQLMVTNGVDIFFQGHDHLYAKESLDGLVYQEVPMPSDSTYEIGMLANADAYTDVTLNGTGHLRVTVSPTCVTVDYIRAYLPADTLSGVYHNGEIAYTYTVGTCATPTETASVAAKQSLVIFPNPAQVSLVVQTQIATAFDRTIELINLQGIVVQTQVLKQGNTTCTLLLQDTIPGVYAIRCFDLHHNIMVKTLVVHP